MATLTATIPSLSAASALSGTDPFETVQSNASVKTTAAGIATYVSAHLTNGVSGSFTTADAKTVTVTNGIITGIA
jgi:hypothetical protein